MRQHTGGKTFGTRGLGQAQIIAWSLWAVPVRGIYGRWE